MSSIALTDLAILGAAVVLAAAGGDAFLKGVLGISEWMRVNALIRTGRTYCGRGPDRHYRVSKGWFPIS